MHTVFTIEQYGNTKRQNEDFSEKRGEGGREGIADYVCLELSEEKIIENSLMFLSVTSHLKLKLLLDLW